jgi:hypothetical protein
MKSLLSCFVIGLFAVTALCPATYAQGAQESNAPLKRRIINDSNEPERRGGNVFASARTIAILVQASLEWDAARKSVRLSRGERIIVFRLGKRVAVANGKQIDLSEAVYQKAEETMLPLRVVAEALAVPCSWEASTESVLAGPVDGKPLMALPLETDRAGFVIHTPTVGQMVAPNIEIHLQANLPADKELVLQLREADDSVLTEMVIRPFERSPSMSPTRGKFLDTRALLAKVSSSDGDRKVRFIAFLRKATQPPLKFTPPDALLRGPGSMPKLSGK